jgi:hypothetical protein
MWFGVPLLRCPEIEGGMGSGACNGHTESR